jgi:ATP-dependent DNA ligase
MEVVVARETSESYTNSDRKEDLLQVKKSEKVFLTGTT